MEDVAFEEDLGLPVGEEAEAAGFDGEDGPDLGGADGERLAGVGEAAGGDGSAVGVEIHAWNVASGPGVDESGWRVGCAGAGRGDLTLISGPFGRRKPAEMLYLLA